MSSSVSTTNYTAYDALGKVTASNQVTDGQTYSMSYAYNLAGGQTSMTYPSGRVVTSGYDDAGRLAGVRDQSSGIYYAGAVSTDATNRVQYAAQGAVSVMKLGNGLWEHTNFNNRLQTTQIGLGTSSTDSSTMSLSYGYGTTNNNGNLQNVSYSGGALSYTQSFSYDALNRLLTAQEGSSWSQTNAYDRYGNRQIDYGGGNYNLAFSSTTNRITTSGYSYDLAGNLTADAIHTYGFDAENKIKTVDGVNGVYSYDGDGNRVRKNFTSGDKLRMVYSNGQLVAEYDLSTNTLKKEYAYGPKGLIATIEPGTGTRYETADHLGSPRLVTNSSGGVVSRHDYMPFGEEIGVGIDGRASAMGFGVNDSLRQKFTGYEREIEMGLDFAEARYYSNIQGRFTSADPLMPSGKVADPQSWNRYAYVGNNPLNSVDPSGMIAGNPGFTSIANFDLNTVTADHANNDELADAQELWDYQVEETIKAAREADFLNAAVSARTMSRDTAEFLASGNPLLRAASQDSQSGPKVIFDAVELLDDSGAGLPNGPLKVPKPINPIRSATKEQFEPNAFTLDVNDIRVALDGLIAIRVKFHVVDGDYDSVNVTTTSKENRRWDIAERREIDHNSFILGVNVYDKEGPVNPIYVNVRVHWKAPWWDQNKLNDVRYKTVPATIRLLLGPKDR